MDGTGFIVPEESEADVPPIKITLREDNLPQISVYLRTSFESKLPTLVSSIVEGVVSSLSEKTRLFSDENVQLKRRVEELEIKADRAEQSSRRNCLRACGIPKTAAESVDEKVIDMATALDSAISVNDMYRGHRLGKPRRSKGQSVKPRDIIIKFTSYRQKLMKNKYKLRPKGINNVFVNFCCNENLTTIRDIKDIS